MSVCLSVCLSVCRERESLVGLNMGLSRTVSKINSDFGRKSQNFPTSSCIYRYTDEGVSLEFCNSAVALK